MVNRYLSSLVQYGLRTGLIEDHDKRYVTNRLLEVLQLDSYEKTSPDALPLEEILEGMVNDAVSRDICEEIHLHPGKYHMHFAGGSGINFCPCPGARGVYKQDINGRTAFLRFIDSINQ